MGCVAVLLETADHLLFASRFPLKLLLCFASTRLSLLIILYFATTKESSSIDWTLAPTITNLDADSISIQVKHQSCSLSIHVDFEPVNTIFHRYASENSGVLSS